MRGNLTAAQNAAMDALLAEVMSTEGMDNIRFQLAWEETFDTGASGGARFGRRHLAINVTHFGPDASCSPMLTGGEPFKVTNDREDVFITEQELQAADAFLASLDERQKNVAIFGTSAINLLSGPGQYGKVIAPEGIKGRDFDADPQALLLDLIAARLGFINADHFALHMDTVSVETDETHFGWWGPEDAPGEAYFRVTGRSIMMKYSPQDQDGDPTVHAHNMYRDPTNDYGTAWITVE